MIDSATAPNWLNFNNDNYPARGGFYQTFCTTSFNIENIQDLPPFCIPCRAIKLFQLERLSFLFAWLLLACDAHLQDIFVPYDQHI